MYQGEEKKAPEAPRDARSELSTALPEKQKKPQKGTS